MCRLFLSSIICVNVCALLLATSVRATNVSLIEAYELALDHAPSVSIARFQIDGARAKKAQALSKLLPQATIFGQWSKNKLSYDSESLVQFDTDYPGQRYGVSVRQSLITVSDGIELNRQGELLELSKEKLRVTEAGLLTEIITAYLDILMSDAEVALLKDEILAVAEQLMEAKALYAKNLISVTEVLETESRQDTLKADRVMAEGRAAVSREALARLTGLRGGEPLAVAEDLALLSRFSDPDQAAAAASLADPLIAAAESEVAAAEQAVLKEKSRWIPDVYLSYNYQHSDVGFDNQSAPARDTSTVAIDFNYPLFQGGAKLARIRGASAEYNTALTTLRSQQLETESRARSAWLVFDAAIERLLAAKQAERSSTVKVTAMRRAAKAGTVRYTDVLLALAQQSRALRDLIDARFFYTQAWVELELASGAEPGPLAEKLSKMFHAS